MSMGRELFEQFPNITTEHPIIRKMTENDADALLEIFSDEAVYRYMLRTLFTKNRATVLNHINRLGGCDFSKKRVIIAGACLFPRAGTCRCHCRNI